MVTVLPVFLFGALVVLIRRDIAFTDPQVGLTISAYFFAFTVSSIPGGKIADRMGPRSGMLFTATVNTAVLVGVGTLATSWWHLFGFLLLGGAAAGIGMPSSNLVVARLVPVARQGVAFGVKQTAAPTAGVLSGLAVPLLGLTFGWRWAFIGIGLVLGSTVALTVRGTIPPHQRSPAAGRGRAPLRPMLLLALTVAFGSAAVAATIGFYVESAVNRGFATSTAGFLLGGGSLFGILARVVWGWIADRREQGHLVFVSWLFAVGSVGFALLGVVETVPLLAAATLLVFVAGWSWAGLVFMVATRGSPGAPGAASGIASTGGGLGGLVGPIAFGAIVEQSSYTVAWFVVALWMIGAAILAQVTLRTWRRSVVARSQPSSVEGRESAPGSGRMTKPDAR